MQKSAEHSHDIFSHNIFWKRRRLKTSWSYLLVIQDEQTQVNRIILHHFLDIVHFGNIGMYEFFRVTRAIEHSFVFILLLPSCITRGPLEGHAKTYPCPRFWVVEFDNLRRWLVVCCGSGCGYFVFYVTHCETIVNSGAGSLKNQMTQLNILHGHVWNFFVHIFCRHGLYVILTF